MRILFFFGSFQVLYFFQDFFIGGDQASHFHKNAHNLNININGLLTPQYAGKHGYTLLSESERSIFNTTLL